MTEETTHIKQTSAATKALRALLRNPFSSPATRKFGGLFLKYLPGQITCQEFENFVIGYHENRLAQDQRDLFERHMRLCPMCRTSFTGYLKTIEMGKKICSKQTADTIFADAPRELIETILKIT